MADRWCTVTVTDHTGKRHSLDVLASSTYDAAHLYVTQAKATTRPSPLLPTPTIRTMFEVVANARVYRVSGTALQNWIEQGVRRGTDPRECFFGSGLTLNKGHPADHAPVVTIMLASTMTSTNTAMTTTTSTTTSTTTMTITTTIAMATTTIES